MAQVTKIGCVEAGRGLEQKATKRTKSGAKRAALRGPFVSFVAFCKTLRLRARVRSVHSVYHVENTPIRARQPGVNATCTFLAEAVFYSHVDDDKRAKRGY